MEAPPAPPRPGLSAVGSAGREPQEVRLEEAGPEELGALGELLEPYLDELVAHAEGPARAAERPAYPYLPAYAAQPGRHALWIRAGEATAGFALVRTPESTGNGRFQVAEFYVRPGFRRQGVGREAARLLWRRFPGAWELAVHTGNAAALRFWRACIEAHAEEPPALARREPEGGGRLRLHFRVPAADVPVGAGDG